MVDSFNADPGKGRIQHHANRFFDRFSDELFQIRRSGAFQWIVGQTFGGTEPFGETGFFQISRFYFFKVIENRVAYQVFIAIPADNDNVVGIKLKSHFRRKIGRIINRDLKPHQLAAGYMFIQLRHGPVRVFIGFAKIGSSQQFGEIFDNIAWKHAVGNHGHVSHFKKRQVCKAQGPG